MPWLVTAAARVTVQVNSTSRIISSHTHPLKFAMNAHGHTYVTGASEDVNHPDPNGSEAYDFIVEAYNQRGILDVIFLSPYQLPPVRLAEVGQNLVFDKTGNLYVSGYSQPERGRFHVTTYKFERGSFDYQNGIAWTNIFTGLESDFSAVTGMAADTNGNVVLVVRGLVRQVVLRLNSNGQTVWAKEYAPIIPAFLPDFHATLDSQGNTIVGAGVAGSQTWPPHIVKFDAAGSLVWSNAIGETEALPFTGVSVGVGTNDQVFAGAVGHRITGTNPPGNPFPTVEYNWELRSFSVDGGLLWTNRGPVAAPVEPMLATDSEGSLYAAGDGADTKRANTAVLTKFSADGALLWDRTTTLPARSTGPLRIGTVEPSRVTLFTDTFRPVPVGEIQRWQRVQITYRQRP